MPLHQRLEVLIPSALVACQPPLATPRPEPQQAWAQALAAYPSLTDARNLRGWLLTITSRAATDSHRARARRPLPVAALPETPVPQAEPHDPALWEAVRALPERQRVAVALHYVLDLPHAAVARALGTTPAASRRLVSDALTTLRSTRTETP